MIIANGTVAFKLKSQPPGLDPETGYPVHPGTAAVWSQPVACQIVAASLDLQAKTAATGSPLKSVRWVIYVEAQPLPQASEQIRLSDDRGESIGDYTITQIEPLDAVSEVRLYAAP